MLKNIKTTIDPAGNKVINVNIDITKISRKIVIYNAFTYLLLNVSCIVLNIFFNSFISNTTDPIHLF